MATKTSKSSDETPEKAPEAPAPEKPKAAVPAPKGRIVAKDSPPPIEPPTMLAARAFRGSSSPIVSAFLTTDKLRHGRRMLTKEQWRAEYEAFVNKER